MEGVETGVMGFGVGVDVVAVDEAVESLIMGEPVVFPGIRMLNERIFSDAKLQAAKENVRVNQMQDPILQ